jgi:hypothetical protein
MTVSQRLPLPSLDQSLSEEYDVAIEISESFSSDNGSTWSLFRKTANATPVTAKRSKEKGWRSIVGRMMETMYESNGSICSSSVIDGKKWSIDIFEKNGWKAAFIETPMFNIHATNDNPLPEGDFKAFVSYPVGYFNDPERTCGEWKDQTRVRREYRFSLTRKS